MPASYWLLVARHCLLFAVVIVAVYTDISRGKIYNWCTLPGIVLGLMVSGAIGGVWAVGFRQASLGGSALAVVIVLVVFAWPYLKGGVAAGDVKLMLAVAAIGGMRRGFVLYALFCTAVIGAAMALLVMLWRQKLGAGLKGALRFTFSLKRGSPSEESEAAPGEKLTIPYGVAISIGSIVAWYLLEIPVR